MTSQIGSKRRSRRAGFTFIELVIVGAIILFLAGISTPLFKRTFRDLELKDAAYRISKVIRYGQDRAVIEEKTYKALFYFDKGEYRLVAEDGEIGSRFGGPFYLPDGVTFKGGRDTIMFFPNGRCDKVSIYLKGGGDKSFEITTNTRGGYVGVSEIKGK